MADPRTCPQCHSPLPLGASEGLCPACLLRRGLEPDTLPNTTQTASHWSPPTPADLAAGFPELDLLELIGRGGMGAVYKARQKNLDRIVALKILPPEIGRDPDFAERFAREAQAMARLSHPNIVTIHDFGRRAHAGGELFFFVMEFVDGMTVRQLLSAGGVSPREALALVPQICDALQYAHDRGIVHRDIKPENILLSRQGQVKIADFGLAKLMSCPPPPPGAPGPAGLQRPDRPGLGPIESDGAPEAAMRERPMGTPQYMAPEQIEHPAQVDHRADIYSLGVVFYQMLTGELPAGTKFAPPSQKVLIDVRLDEVVLRALEREPARRYQQVSEVKTDVETIMATLATPVPSTSPLSSWPSTRPSEPIAGAPAAALAIASPPLGRTAHVVSHFSRTAIVGAVWMPWTFLCLTFRLAPSFPATAGTAPTGPTWWQVLLLLMITGLGVTAPFGATICGIMSLAQIRHSHGRLYGLGLATFDALVFPLLVLDAILAGALDIGMRLLVYAKSLELITASPAWMAAIVTVVMLLTLAVIVAADVLIIRRVWRAVKKSANNAGTTNPQHEGGGHGPASPRTSPLAIWSFVLALTGPFGAIPAVICGHMALPRIKRSSGKLIGRGFAIAGLVIGYAGIVLLPVLLLGAVTYSGYWGASQEEQQADQQAEEEFHWEQRVRDLHQIELDADRAEHNPLATGLSQSVSQPAKELKLDLGNGASMKLVQIPAGKFLMGSPETEQGRYHDETQHQVTISRPFYLGITHVTVDQFAAFVKDSGYKTDDEKYHRSQAMNIAEAMLVVVYVTHLSWRNPGFDQKGDHPVVQVSWNDTQAFCAWLSKKSGKTVVLPTEAQWEYACRAGTTTAYPWGDNPDDGKGWANCADQSLWTKAPNAGGMTFFHWDDGYVFTSPVGCFKPNGFGLYDMIGNAFQWCQDRAEDYDKGAATDPLATDAGSPRVLRGGAWHSSPRDCRSADRLRLPPDARLECRGFRVAVVAGAE